MAQKVLILGDSGTGKSASLRNFKPEEILVINSAGKPLPFKNHFECYKPSFEKLTKDVLSAMDSTKKKVIVIDDAQYIMSFQYMRRIKENGWDKWNDIQGDFFNIIKHCDELPDDVVVYFLSHIQRDDEGHEKIKTMGKMLDEKITIEGLFTTVLKTSVKDGQYCFLTQNSGLDTVKSPIGLFETYAIDNDLKYVDTKIRNYYEIGDYASDEVVKALDQEASKPEVVKPDADGRRRRRSEVATVDKGTGATPEEQKHEDAPKRRSRNDRNVETQKEEPAEAPAEEKKEESTADERESGGSAGRSADDGNTDTGRQEVSAGTERKVRRRKVRAEFTEIDPTIETDEEIPF
jgi:hypothetical protein